MYDLGAPYSYGNPVSNTKDNKFLLRGVRDYKEHCWSQNIVFKFIRFHLFNSLGCNPYLFDMHSFDRDTIVINLNFGTMERRKYG